MKGLKWPEPVLDGQSQNWNTEGVVGEHVSATSNISSILCLAPSGRDEEEEQLRIAIRGSMRYSNEDTACKCRNNHTVSKAPTCKELNELDIHSDQRIFG